MKRLSNFSWKKVLAVALILFLSSAINASSRPLDDNDIIYYEIAIQYKYDKWSRDGLSGNILSDQVKKTIEAALINNDIKAMYELSKCFIDGVGCEKNLEKAFEWIEKSAEQGNTDAYFKIAEMYEKGEGVTQNYNKAFYWYEKAAESGNPDAPFLVAEMYDEGKGVAQDYEKALFWYKKAADNKSSKYDVKAKLKIYIKYDNGKRITENLKKYWESKASGQTSIDSSIALAGLFFEENDIPNSFTWVKKAAELGSCEGMEGLAGVYLDDDYSYKDINQALIWMKKAVDAKCVGAHRQLAFQYVNGKNFQKNIIKAIELYQVCAKDGDSECAKRLAWIYQSSRHGIQNIKEAIRWHEMAAKNPESWESDIFIGEAFWKGEGVTKNYEKAFDWYNKAAKKGSVRANYWLAMMYGMGEGRQQNFDKSIELIEELGRYSHEAYKMLGDYFYSSEGKQDFSKALVCYDKAAEMGNDEVLGTLSYLYYLGVSKEKNRLDKAYTFASKAADKGDGGGFYVLGNLYNEGKVVPQNFAKAISLWEKAALKRIIGAMDALAVSYYNGDTIPQNFLNAYVWYTLAVANSDSILKDKFIKDRNDTGRKLSPEQLNEAQQIADTIQYKIDNPVENLGISDTHNSDDIEQDETNKKQTDSIKGSGTGFIITKDGYVITCFHVIDGASPISVSDGNNEYPAEVIREDKLNDLALLKINGKFDALPFSASRTAKMGMDVFTVGYPNPILQGLEQKLTDGIISSLTGYNDDIRLYQISVPVQPGNSGGPLIDKNGNVIGVIVSILNAEAAFKVTGSLPQNVNYALKSTYAQALVDTVPSASGGLLPPSNAKSFESVVEEAQKSVVMIISYGESAK